MHPANNAATETLKGYILQAVARVITAKNRFLRVVN